MDFHLDFYKEPKDHPTSLKLLLWPLGTLVQVQKPPHPKKSLHELKSRSLTRCFISQTTRSFFLGAGPTKFHRRYWQTIT